MAQKNFFAHGGSELVIGGKLTFLPGAVVEGADGLLDVQSDLIVECDEPPFFPDSEATTIAALRADFNALLAVLRDAGLLSPVCAVITTDDAASVEASLKAPTEASTETTHDTDS